MRNDFVDKKPVDFDFGEGYGERWDTVEPFGAMDQEALADFIRDRTGNVDMTMISPEEADEDRLEVLRDAARDCAELDEFAPMMNYVYPINGNPEQLQAALMDTCLVVVLIDEEPKLALAGGGMDLSWEICDAYIKLGYLPPAHFCELPKMAGRGSGEGDQAIMGHCLTSLEMLSGWNRHAAERLREHMLEGAK